MIADSDAAPYHMWVIATLLLSLLLADAGAVPSTGEVPSAGTSTMPIAVAPPEQAALSPGSPEFDARIVRQGLRLEARNMDGKLIRRANAVLTSTSGYVMTSLEAVAGASTFSVAGGMLKEPREAKALAVTRKGNLAILQLVMTADDRLEQPPRAKVPPVVGDRLYSIDSTGQPRKEGRVVSISEAKDGGRLLTVSIALESGTPLYNARGELAAITRRSTANRTVAVYAPERMPGDWVEYFPARVGEPIVKKPPEKVELVVPGAAGRRPDVIVVPGGGSATASPGTPGAVPPTH